MAGNAGHRVLDGGSDRRRSRDQRLRVRWSVDALDGAVTLSDGLGVRERIGISEQIGDTDVQR